MNCCNESDDHICQVCGNINENNVEDKRNLSVPLKEISVLSELDKIKITDEAKIAVTKLYQRATNGKIRRNAPRRATIYCCLIHVCKTNRIIFDPDEYRKLLNIKKKDINNIAKTITCNLPDINISVKIEDLLKCLMAEYNIKDDCFDDLMFIYDKCNKQSMIFNSSKMNTLAVGLIYYYLITYLEDFDKEEYFKESKVSKPTIIKVYDEIQKYMEMEK